MGAGSLKMTRSFLEETGCYFRHWDQHVPILFPETFKAVVVWKKVKYAYVGDGEQWLWIGQGVRVGLQGGGPGMQI